MTSKIIIKIFFKYFRFKIKPIFNKLYLISIIEINKNSFCFVFGCIIFEKLNYVQGLIFRKRISQSLFSTVAV